MGEQDRKRQARLGQEDRIQVDRALMLRIQAGDVEAFELLYARYAHPLLNFFFQMCFDRTASARSSP